jgi:hypothetical protein
VIVRPLAGFGMPDCIRITIGLPEENERLVKTLARIREEVVTLERRRDRRPRLLGGSVALAARAARPRARWSAPTRSADARRAGARDGRGRPDRAARRGRARRRPGRARDAGRRDGRRRVRAMAPGLAPGCVVTDVGSVKAPLVDTLPGLLPPGLHLRRVAPDGGQPPPRHGARARRPARARGVRA